MTKPKSIDGLSGEEEHLALKQLAKEDKKRYDLTQDRDIDVEKCPECGTVLDNHHDRASCRGCGYEESA